MLVRGTAGSSFPPTAALLTDGTKNAGKGSLFKQISAEMETVLKNPYFQAFPSTKFSYGNAYNARRHFQGFFCKIHI